jgi:hypothetical protein
MLRHLGMVVALGAAVCAPAATPTPTQAAPLLAPPTLTAVPGLTITLAKLDGKISDTSSSEPASAQKPTTQLPQGYIQDIRSVDFNNFTFLSVECWGGPRVERLEVRNGEAEVVLGSTEFDRFYFLVDTAYQDLTGDGSEEAIVSLTCIQPASNHPILGATKNIYIYTVQNGSLALIVTLTHERIERDIEGYYNLSLWGHGEERVSGGDLVIERLAGFPAACPPYVASLRYRLEGDTLLLADRPVVRYNPECKK